jgi:hypothetical protein
VPSRVLNRLLSFVLVFALSLPALAQFKRDANANQKIDEAINTHYLMMELDKAEAMLTSVVDACEDQCSAATKAKAWMYVGLVRGSGKNDLGGAKEAFATAKSIDPNVRLDEGLATPETKAAFDGTGGGSAAAVAVAPAAAPPPPMPAGEVPGDMICTPEVTEIATRMPIPVSCQSAINPASAVLKFKEYGSSAWKKIDMQKVGDTFQAEIPCNLTGVAGPLEYYVGAKNQAGEYVDQYGSKKQPARFNLSEGGATDLSFPGQVAVTRCASNDDCPPDFPGCGSSAPRECGEADWGATCKNSTECKCGLTCDGGTCVQAAACSADSDCGSGEGCFDGYCGVKGGGSTFGPHSKHWFGVTFGADVTFLGGTQLCTPARNESYSSYCLNADGTNYAGSEVYVDQGPAMGQLRIKLAYDYAIIDKLTVGARLGFAFVNAPTPAAGATYIDTMGNPQPISGFLPLHLEARAAYTFSSLAKPGLRFNVFVNGGLMEMSTAIPLGPDTANGVMRGQSINVHKRGGVIGFGGGAALGYAIKPNMVVSFETGFVMLVGSYAPTVGIHPALGFTYGL